MTPPPPQDRQVDRRCLALARVVFLGGTCLAGAMAEIAQAAEISAAEQSDVVVLVGERPDSWRLEQSVGALLASAGIAVEWRRIQDEPSRDTLLPPTNVGRAEEKRPRTILIDLREVGAVSLSRATTVSGGAMPGPRVVPAPSLDEATCETIAQIVRSLLLAPDEIAPPVAPADVVRPTPDQRPREPTALSILPPLPSSVVPPRFDLRSGYTVTEATGELGALGGPMVAASWALKAGTDSPVFALSVSRVTTTFAAPGTPVDAAVAVWSLRMGMGWERSWNNRWWLAAEATVGADRIVVTPRSKGSSGFQPSTAGSRYRAALRPLVRGAVQVAGPVLVFLQAQADVTTRMAAYLEDGPTTWRYPLQGRMAMGAVLGAALRW